MTLILAETSVVKSRPSVPHGANLFIYCADFCCSWTRWNNYCMLLIMFG